MMRRFRSWRTVAAVGLVAAVLAGMSLLEGDVAEDLTHFGSLVTGLLNRFGAAASFALLYIEESGVPLPVPGDVYVAYLGRLNSSSISNLLLAWLGIIAVVVGGSTNLYLVSRRWAPAILRHRFVHDVLGVDEARLERAVNAYLTLQKAMAEGAGAAGLAAMLVKPERFRSRRVGLVLCGGNIDPRILASIMVRELEREDRIVSFRLTIPDRPGVLGHIATRLGELGANILGVEHRRLFLDVPAKGARLDVTMETRDQAHAQEIFQVLEADGFSPVWIDTATTME